MGKEADIKVGDQVRVTQDYPCLCGCEDVVAHAGTIGEVRGLTTAGILFLQPAANVFIGFHTVLVTLRVLEVMHDGSNKEE